ncbi:MAG: CRISPR-associated endonuclease Cas1 [Nitrospirae bacterium]|nr:CRISPR-associated endonuclease Cas1 [Nitrospirota bacterium]
MGTLYIDRKDLYIKLDGNALSFYNNNEREGMVPIKPLKRVVVVGNVTLETPVLHKLSDEGISVIFLSGKRTRFCGMLHGRLHNNALLRVKQYEKSITPSLEFSRDIVSMKVTAQADLLRNAMTTRHDLRLPLKTAIDTLEKVIHNITNGDTIDSIRGYEGGASASYFSAYTRLFPESLRFKNRNRRPPQDPVNAILSLCYTLLHFELVREIEVIGLDPTIGFYHQFEYGRESLACDLVESYRPDVDRFVWDIFRERKFTDRDFSNEDERPGCYLKKESRKRFYPLYEEWAQTMRSKFVEEVRSLARRIMDGQDPLPE